MKKAEFVPVYKKFQELVNEYPESWVLLLDPETAETGIEYRGGMLIFQHKQKRKVIEKALTLPKNSKIAIVFTGEISIPKNTIICL